MDTNNEVLNSLAVELGISLGELSHLAQSLGFSAESLSDDEQEVIIDHAFQWKESGLSLDEYISSSEEPTPPPAGMDLMEAGAILAVENQKAVNAIAQHFISHPYLLPAEQQKRLYESQKNLTASLLDASKKNTAGMQILSLVAAAPHLGLAPGVKEAFESAVKALPAEQQNNPLFTRIKAAATAKQAALPMFLIPPASRAKALPQGE